MSSKGMVLVDGKTYRVIHVEAAAYRVVRILDELDVGRFELGPQLRLWASDSLQRELRDVAHQAVRSGKASRAERTRHGSASRRLSFARARLGQLFVFVWRSSC